MRLSELAVAAECEPAAFGVDLDLKSVTQDSRKAKAGVLFAALPGATVNGLDFVDAAIQQGVSALLLPMHVARASNFPLPVLGSHDCRRSFGLAAAAMHSVRSAHRIAVTGTNGKTSIAHFARELLTACGAPTASAGTLGLMPVGLADLPPLTTPDPVALFSAMEAVKQQGFDHFIMEASSHGLDQRRLDGFEPEIAVFTNLSRDHLDYHVGMQAYAEAKFRLFRTLLAKTGSIVTNLDDVFSERLAGLGRHTISYGREDSDLQILSVSPTLTGQALDLRLMGKQHKINVPQIGSYQAHNLMAALGVALCCDISLDRALSKISALPGVPGRMEIAASANQKLAIVDYAHTPEALDIALQSARPHTSGKLRVVFGAGGDRDPGKRPLMGKAAAEQADVAYVTDDNPRTEEPSVIREQVLAGDKRLIDAGDRETAIARAMEECTSGDVLVIAGKGHEPYQDIKGVKHDFDDRLVAATFAAQLWS